MVKRLAIPSKEAELKIVGPIDSFIASRVQRVNLNTDVPSNDVDELGNNLHAGTSTGIPAVTLTFSAMDVGIKIFSVLTGTDPDAYPGAGVDIASLTECDAIIYIKDDTVMDYIKSAHARRVQVRDFTFNYAVDGDSTEDYTMVGAEKRWFKNDVVVDKFTTGTTSFTLNDTPIQLLNGRYALSVIVDGVYMTEVSTAPATGEYRVVGTTLTTGDTRSDQVLAIYHADPAGTNWSYVSDTVTPATIQGKDVAISIEGNNILRVQSVTVNGAMNVQEVREMGNRSLAGYQRQVPSVTGTLTVLDTDTDLMDLFLFGSIESGNTEFEIGQGCVASGVYLEVQLRDPCDVDDTIAVLKTIYIPDIHIDGDSFASNVNNNATQTFNWRSIDSQCIVYSGARV